MTKVQEEDSSASQSARGQFIQSERERRTVHLARAPEDSSPGQAQEKDSLSSHSMRGGQFIRPELEGTIVLMARAGGVQFSQPEHKGTTLHMA